MAKVKKANVKATKNTTTYAGATVVTSTNVITFFGSTTKTKT